MEPGNFSSVSLPPSLSQESVRGFSADSNSCESPEAASEPIRRSNSSVAYLRHLLANRQRKQEQELRPDISLFSDITSTAPTSSHQLALLEFSELKGASLIATVPPSAATGISPTFCQALMRIDYTESWLNETNVNQNNLENCRAYRLASVQGRACFGVYFNLWDDEARGFTRRFCLALLFTNHLRHEFTMEKDQKLLLLDLQPHQSALYAQLNELLVQPWLLANHEWMSTQLHNRLLDIQYTINHQEEMANQSVLHYDITTLLHWKEALQRTQNMLAHSSIFKNHASEKTVAKEITEINSDLDYAPKLFIPLPHLQESMLSMEAYLESTTAVIEPRPFSQLINQSLPATQSFPDDGWNSWLNWIQSISLDTDLGRLLVRQHAWPSLSYQIPGFAKHQDIVEKQIIDLAAKTSFRLISSGRVFLMAFHVDSWERVSPKTEQEEKPLSKKPENTKRTSTHGIPAPHINNLETPFRHIWPHQNPVLFPDHSHDPLQMVKLLTAQIELLPHILFALMCGVPVILLADTQHQQQVASVIQFLQYFVLSSEITGNAASRNKHQPGVCSSKVIPWSAEHIKYKEFAQNDLKLIALDRRVGVSLQIQDMALIWDFEDMWIRGRRYRGYLLGWLLKILGHVEDDGLFLMVCLERIRDILAELAMFRQNQITSTHKKTESSSGRLVGFQPRKRRTTTAGEHEFGSARASSFRNSDESETAPQTRNNLVLNSLDDLHRIRGTSQPCLLVSEEALNSQGMQSHGSTFLSPENSHARDRTTSGLFIGNSSKKTAGSSSKNGHWFKSWWKPSSTSSQPQSDRHQQNTPGKVVSDFEEQEKKDLRKFLSLIHPEYHRYGTLNREMSLTESTPREERAMKADEISFDHDIEWMYYWLKTYL